MNTSTYSKEALNKQVVKQQDSCSVRAKEIQGNKHQLIANPAVPCQTQGDPRVTDICAVSYALLSYWSIL